MSPYDDASDRTDLLARARAWADDDPDDVTRDELRDLVRRAEGDDAAAIEELDDAFSGTLQFGTAGLRGRLGPGPNRMNRVVVARAAAGLAAYLTGRGLTDGPVLIGHDARHNSDVFARDSAEIIAAAGLRAVLIEDPVPTPVVAFGIGHLGAVAAVVVTASHNPPQDNGYKVYLGDGSQIVPPADADIAARIDEVSGRPVASIRRSDDWTAVGSELLDSYVARAASLVPAGAPRELTLAYTPLHGVGGRVVAAVLEQAGFPAAGVVASQAEPDPDFPTVAFPNPEEPGAMDALLDLARESGADVAIANDPDADRCAIAVPDVAADGGWRVLRGDELGGLLGDLVLRAAGPGAVAACSIVSSGQLEPIARSYSAEFTRTLTGFKWIGRVPGLTFGYEEALGYCADPGAVKDKDGITALVRIVAAAAQARAEGRTLADVLDELCVRTGLYATDQVSFRVEELSLITDAMARLRSEPPAELSRPVVGVGDLATPTDDLPPTDGLVFTLEGDARVVVRPSGTEPKLKCYLEVVHPVGSVAELPSVRERAAADLAAIGDAVRTALAL